MIIAFWHQVRYHFAESGIIEDISWQRVSYCFSLFQSDFLPNRIDTGYIFPSRGCFFFFFWFYILSIFSSFGIVSFCRFQTIKTGHHKFGYSACFPFCHFLPSVSNLFHFCVRLKGLEKLKQKKGSLLKERKKVDRKSLMNLLPDEWFSDTSEIPGEKREFLWIH